jgi:hypothetical protein
MQIRMAFIFLLEGGHSRIQIKFYELVLHSFKTYVTQQKSMKN